MLNLPSARSATGYFYQFLGAHSLLIGLLPFFLPVYLWQKGLDLAGLSLLVGVSGLSFAAALSLWQRMARRWPMKHLISLTFALEFLLIASVGLLTEVPGAALFTPPDGTLSVTTAQLCFAALVIGMANGFYNAFFWTSQRTLFLRQLGSNDTGRQYGNFQIFVTLILKIGILLGGTLLETGGLIWLLALSAGISLASSRHLATQPPGQQPIVDPETLAKPVTILRSLAHKDGQGSRAVFLSDGIFLYLESHFWTLTLFLMVREDFSRLGIAVVVLALVFAALFYLVKNRIDQLDIARVYRAAVWLYLASWLLRFTLNTESEGASLWIALIFITFFSSFFRLAFNKRFFDVARTNGSMQYLLIKSYLSQIFLGLTFLILGAALLVIPIPHDLALQYLYVPAGLLSLIYLRYSDKD
ncbi:hypothetical protein [Granulosicoccus antarcticus]|uniref:Major facilitator superfamily (MFS) profile domain-containing protein n=1 Tax=Granulosicoccus antarcticus IMCC3135 TaxID=1192854 RepID=A0A2Z2NKP4_9GAMM|nr:hypothetical protein [Granulosicoccus antarcticus]ASJ71713.1 hypothetical protein IMCC3135_08050 [Granulosicoccus antarcticus IMCC3135]